MNHHLIILEKAHLERILLGTKTTECRLSHTRRLPFGRVSVGDTLWLKQSGKPVSAKARVRAVRFLHPFAKTELIAMRRRFGRILATDEPYYATHSDARYATFIRLGSVQPIEPIHIRKSSRHAWVILAGPPKPSNR